MRLQSRTALFVASVLLAGLQVSAADPRSSRDDLTAASFAELHKLIGPQPGDYRWGEVPWLTSLWHARKKAAAEDKPILCFGTAGAGFNDPLGNC